MSASSRRLWSSIAIAMAFLVDIVGTFVSSVRLSAFALSFIVYLASLVSYAQEQRRPDPDLGFARMARLVALVAFLWGIALAIVYIKG